MLIPTRSLVWLSLLPLVLACMVPFDETLLWPMLVTDAAIVALALVDALASGAKLVTVSRRSPEVFSIGRHNPVTVELRSRARRRLRVELTCELFDHAEAEGLPIAVELGAGGHAVERFRVTPRRRGAFKLGDSVVRWRSPLGLWKRQQRYPAHHPVRVYPDVQAVRTWELLARQDRQHSLMRTTRRLGGESEFEQLRDYSRDDEFRSIDWKASARRSKLTSRQYQLESNQNLMFVIDAGRLMTAETGGLSLFDHALNASLMLAHVAARGGDRVGLLSYADEVLAFTPPSSGRAAVRSLIQASYALHPELVESNPELALAQLNVRVRKRTLVILFTQVIDERAATELLRVTRSLSPRHLPLIVLFRDPEVFALLDPHEGARAALPAGRASELELYTRGAAAELLSWREQLIRKLKEQGALILDADPHTRDPSHGDAGSEAGPQGSDTRALTPALINRYLEIKARHLL